MPICPSCGSINFGGDGCPDCGKRLDLEEEIAGWVEGGLEESQADGAEVICPKCGYMGEMTIEDEGWVKICPACQVVTSSRRSSVAPVDQFLECAGCGRRIGVTRDDEGTTVICPGCAYFLGTYHGPEGRPKRVSWRGRDR